MKLSYSWLDKGIVLTVLLGGFGYIVMNVLIEIFLVLPLILTMWIFAWVFTLYLASLVSACGCDVLIRYDAMVGYSSYNT